MKPTKLSYGWRDSMRLRRGLYWKDDAPTMADMPKLRTALLYVLAALLAVTMAVKTAEASSVARESIIQYTEAEAMLLDCLNGRPVGYTLNKTGHGHGRTYIICRVEEIEV